MGVVGPIGEVEFHGLHDPAVGVLNPVADRFAIRAMRAEPAWYVASKDPARTQVFRAALGQFDELLDATAAAGPTSRPLPLYYALNQAGRAIIAGRQKAGRPWRPTEHGLLAQMPADGSLPHVVIRPKPKSADSGIAQLLAEAMGTRRLQHPTTFAQVWSAIPDFPRPGLASVAGMRRPVRVTVDWDMASDTGLTAEPDFKYGSPMVSPLADKAAVREMIRDNFPWAADSMKVDHAFWDSEQGRVSVRLSWWHSKGVARQPYERLDQYLAQWWMLPKLNPQKDVLTPFMLWWTLLLALSTIARYHPAEWGAALDPDQAMTTVPIERVLQQALEILPRLVLLALRGWDV